MSVSIEQLKSMNADEYQLIDMRNESEIAHGEIPGAITIQAEEIENSELIDKTKRLIICCSRGQNSIEVAQNLVEKGYDAESLEGGYVAWLLDMMKQQEAEAKLSGIRGEVTDIGWGNQIRSYVMQPYTMVKDHRTSEETGNVDAVLDGDIDPFINAYLKWIALSNKPAEQQ